MVLVPVAQRWRLSAKYWKVVCVFGILALHSPIESAPSPAMHQFLPMQCLPLTPNKLLFCCSFIEALLQSQLSATPAGWLTTFVRVHAPRLKVTSCLADEPTSGLDSTTAMHLLTTLRELASGGRAVVTTIHQPSSRLYFQLDKLLLLSEGHVLYYGELTWT